MFIFIETLAQLSLTPPNGIRFRVHVIVVSSTINLESILNYWKAFKLSFLRVKFHKRAITFTFILETMFLNSLERVSKEKRS